MDKKVCVNGAVHDASELIQLRKDLAGGVGRPIYIWVVLKGRVELDILAERHPHIKMEVV